MITQPHPTLERAVSRRFATLADEASVTRTAAALEANGIAVLRASDAAEAKRLVLGLIPDGAEVHHGASQTLESTGHHRRAWRSPAAMTPFVRASGAWTARPRRTRSAACPRRPT